MINQHFELPMDKIVAFCEKYPIRKLSLFGSILRDDFRPDSDVDVLVEFLAEASVTYFDLAKMQMELSDLIEREIDLLTPGALSQYFQQKVMNTAQVVYERK